MAVVRPVLVLVLASAVWAVRVPDNPCPDTFQYRQQGGVYYGEVTIPYDGSKNLNLAVNISMSGLYQNAKLRIDLQTPAENILNSPVLLYRINFPFPNNIPKITQITFNGRIYCYGPSEQLGTEGVTNLWSNLVYRINQYTYSIESGLKQPQPQNYISESTTARTSSDQQVCGLANDVHTLVLKGQKTNENEFPWLVAMFHHQGVTYEFQCTGNLITHKHVLTAAHCVWFYKAPLISKEDILLVLGRSDISRWASTGALIRTALEVTPHPDYRQGSGHCDLAVITMNEEVMFKPNVRPVCLWGGETEEAKEGMVAGWGKSEGGAKAAPEPRKITMPVASQEACLRSHRGFENITSVMTFCAGKRDGSGPCSGDSGAGFVAKRGGRWYLKGLVSTAIKNEDFSCNLNEYIVFADVGRLRGWIESVTGNK